jgi:hypothetical protein
MQQFNATTTKIRYKKGFNATTTGISFAELRFVNRYGFKATTTGRLASLNFVSL